MKTLKCIGCGAEKKATTKRYNKLVADAGGEEQLKKNYKCRSCRPKKEKEEK